MPPTAYVNNPGARNFVSHYGRQRDDIIVDGGNASNCSYCHRGGGNEFGEVFEEKSNANITHGIGFAVNCSDCHGYGRIHDAAISSPTLVPGNNSLCMNTACHSNPSNTWFVDISTFNSSIHRGANCTDCHAPLPIAVDGRVNSGGTYHRSFEVYKDTKQMNVTLKWVSGSLKLTLDADGV
ncbi:MAG: hypothetical protein C5S49_07480 [Candidatus Methanogaster sp.]|nr:MAG: hypothetical protein C5S49_07480 [ANME-2 cluster archaeon]